MNRAFRKSSIFGPFTTSQWINRVKWGLIIPLPFLLYIQKKRVVVDAQLPPLLENDIQPFDHTVTLEQWNDIRTVLNPYWNKTSQKTLNAIQSSEVEFLRNFSWSAQVHDEVASNDKNKVYVAPKLSQIKLNQ
ncbi:divalent metal cation transporter [Acrasis kona]|uniref:Divalent metal cation transporter n=1 Tax=Acrasis kona TaxID=1008807 RepID=A0AAW2YX06_9EUKA